MVAIVKKVWKKLGGNIGMKTDRTWTPELEKTLEGVYVELKNIKTKEGKESKLYVIREANGKLAAAWGTAMLDRLMAEAKIGDEVRITFVQKSFNKDTGHSLKEFIVESPEVEGTESKEDDHSGKNLPF